MMNTSSGIVGWFVEKKHNITKHFSLSEANDSLAAENADLRTMLPESYYKLQDQLFYINDTLYEQQYQYIPAQVINSSDNKRNNYFTLNKGTKSGVEEGMGVIAKEGIVGFVVDVSNHYCLVRTVLSENINISVKSTRNNEHWPLKWDGTNNELVQLNGVTHDIEIAEGDTIVTRGNKGVFPENQIVGFVDEISVEDGKLTKNVSVRLAVNFGAAYHVYIVRNLLKKEQEELEGEFFEEEEDEQ